MHPITFVSMCTVRVVCYERDEPVSVGTGFFYLAKVQMPDGIASIPIVVTNKHVVDGYSELRLVLTLSPHGVEPPANVVAETDTHRTFVIPALAGRLVSHPDPAVDLCAFFVQDIDNDVGAAGMGLRHAYLDSSWVLGRESQTNLRAIETILMLGYPNGLWDATNNRPLARKGTTASHPFIRWNGRPEFVIDAACFPGSSGSPVFLFEDPFYRAATDAYTPGTRLRLLGVLASGPTIDRQGRLVQREVPTSTDVPVFSEMMNLGNVICSDSILELEATVVEVACKSPVYVRAYAL